MTTTLYDPDAYLVSLTRALGEYVRTTLNDLDTDVEMSFPDTSTWTKETPLRKALIHFEQDDDETPQLGFGMPGVDVYDAVAKTFQVHEAAEHIVNFDVGVWVSAESGGTTKRMELVQALKSMFSSVRGKLALHEATGGLWVVSFNGGRNELDRINSLPVWRALNMSLIVRVFSRHKPLTADPVPSLGLDQTQALTIDGVLVLPSEQEERMITATTLAGLGTPQQDGVFGSIKVGAWPDTETLVLQWNLAEQKWIGEEFVVLSLLDQWGLRLDDTVDLTQWQYFYRPVYFASPPTGGWGTIVTPVDRVASFFAAGLRLQEHVSGLMNGNDTVAMQIIAYYQQADSGDAINLYAPSGGLGFGNSINGPVSTHTPGGGGERGMEWRPSPDPGWRDLAITVPTKRNLLASLFGKMLGAGPLTGAGKSGEISDVVVKLRWVGP